MGLNQLIVISVTIYKLSILAIGFGLSWMGYRLFMADIKNISAGEFEGNIKNNRISLKQAAPGTFFTVLGCTIICLSTIKGIEFQLNYENQESSQEIKPELPKLKEPKK